MTDLPFRIDDEEAARDAITAFSIPVSVPHSPATLTKEELEPLIGGSVSSGLRGWLEMRPFHQCPHCKSYDYRLVWQPRGPVEEREALFVCDRCELRVPTGAEEAPFDLP